MSDISLSKAVRSNLLALQGTADMMAVAQTRLSTGNKVNSALDNPSNWFTAKGLTNRSSDLNALMDSMANGIQTLKAADNGLSAMTKTLESMQSTLRQARQDKTFQTTSLNLDPAASGNISLSGGSIGDIPVDVSLQKATFTGNGGFAGPGNTAQDSGILSFEAGDKVNGGSAVTIAYAKGDTAATVAQKINDRMGRILGGTAVTATVKSGQLQLSNTNNQPITDVSGGQTIGLSSVGDAAQPLVAATQAFPAVGTGQLVAGTVTIGGKTINTSATGVNAAAGPPAVTATSSDANGTALAQQLNDAFLDEGMQQYSASSAGGVITITRADGQDFTTSGTAPLTLAATTTTNGDIALNSVTATTGSNAVKTADELVESINANASLANKVRASNDNGKLRLENLSTQKMVIAGASGGNITGVTSAKSEVTGNSVRAGLASQFNELRDQLDKLADDASFNGINLMRGDKLTITFNETGTSSIDIQTKNGDTINSANLGVPTSLQEEQLDSDVDIDSLLADMKVALDSVRSQASTFGSNLSIVQNRQDFTKAMIDTLETGAGNLTLADMNEEAANLLALQTRQQLSSNSLSLASQADQSVLQLLR